MITRADREAITSEREETEPRAGAPRPLAQRVARAAVFAAAAVGLLAMSIALGGVFSGTGSESRRGQDAHAKLFPGSILEVTTEAGAQVTVTVQKVSGTVTDPEIVVLVSAGDDRVQEEGAWRIRLDDGSELPLATAAGERLGEARLWREGGLPPGRTGRSFHFDPDGSAGDLYFDFK